MPPQRRLIARAASHPDTVPATVLAASGPRAGIASCPCDRYHSGVAIAAAAPHASIAIGEVPGARTIQNPSPPMAFMCGYTTATVAAAATIASMALPPSRRIASPDWAAR